MHYERKSVFNHRKTNGNEEKVFSSGKKKFFMVNPKGHMEDWVKQDFDPI